MAISSLSATIIPSPTLFSPLSSHSSKPKLLPFSASSSTALKLKPLQFSLPSTRVYAAPEVLDSSDTIEPPPEILEGSGVATLEVCDDFVRNGAKCYNFSLFCNGCKNFCSWVCFLFFWGCGSGCNTLVVF